MASALSFSFVKNLTQMLIFAHSIWNGKYWLFSRFENKNELNWNAIDVGFFFHFFKFKIKLSITPLRTMDPFGVIHLKNIHIFLVEISVSVCTFLPWIILQSFLLLFCSTFPFCLAYNLDLKCVPFFFQILLVFFILFFLFSFEIY